ncbi:unnamed protein product [Clonostachys rosea f. rosea IK726]|uniref:Uncharacterized protein n=1 Tax=Clonostachys rosea f. rosea IK726 TaxID=1349383 RepID=A0ACA9UAH1_BIOOC|nr:unnamed protein product [Clonostachys rosea f. rosea IK726]
MSDINVTPEIQNARMPPNLSREERMAFMANHVEAIQKLNPEADMKLDTNWWKASVNLSSDIDEFLDAETKKKVNETTMKMFQPGAGLDTAKAVREELKDLLVGHEISINPSRLRCLRTRIPCNKHKSSLRIRLPQVNSHSLVSRNRRAWVLSSPFCLCIIVGSIWSGFELAQPLAGMNL